MVDRTVTLLHRLYSRLPVLLGAVLVLLVVMGGVIVQSLRQLLLSGAGERLAVTAAAITEKLDRALFERQGDIQILTRVAAGQERDPVPLSAFLGEFRDLYSFYDWVGVMDAQGRVIAATEAADIGRSLASAEWFEAARAGGQAQVLDAVRLPKPGTLDRPGVMFAMPLVGRDGAFRGAVATHIALDKVDDLINETIVTLLVQQGTGARVEYQLIRADGELLADSVLREEGRINLLRAGPPSARHALSSPPGFIEETHARRQVPVLTGYARSKGFESFPGLGWVVLVRMDKDDLLAPVTALLWRLGLFSGVGLLPLLGFLFWVLSRLQVEWHRGRQERNRALVAEAAAEERAQVLEQLAETGRLLTGERDLDRLMQMVVEAARRLTGARYAAVGIWDKTETQLVQFLTAGLDDSVRQAIGPPPMGRGLLGHLAREGGPLRLKDLTQHPAFTGFPPHHPPMRSFLGIAVRVRGRRFGQIYLTDKEGPDRVVAEFTKLDEELIGALAAHVGIVVENCVTLKEVQDLAEQLTQANVSLRTVNREIEEMTSIVAHDLKAPLVTIQGYAGRLVAAYAGHPDEKSRRAVTVILDVSKIMGAMLEGLLEVSRLSRRALRPRRCGIAETVERACVGLGEQIAAAGVTVSVHLDPAAASVWADPVAFYQIVQNLLSNALKFGSPDRPLAVQIGTTVQESRTLFWIRDNGVGIPADKQEAVFQIFRKLNRNTPGVGIGLAAVKNLVQQSGGTVWIKSEPGQGTTVFVALPVGEDREGRGPSRSA
jgi:signal transduction histidine kinase